ncbi:MAG: patatin family protein [Acidobacteriaceae bacterium]|nr:patatin family protein [Acidobacteriaceae bacterium]
MNAEVSAAPVPQDNQAWPGHPVVQEIIRRGRLGLKGNSEWGAPGAAKLGLVVEGGGMRGIYSGSCLVALEQLGLTDVFDKVFGESAGAINSCYFLAGQGAFGIKIYLEDLTSLKFANPLRFGTMLDVGYAIDVVVKSIKPLDVERVLSSPSDLYIALTDAITGEGRLVDVRGEKIDLLDLLRATGAIVPLYNRAVSINGHPYVDGGISNPIPIRSAISAGCTHILVVLTRPVEFVSTPIPQWLRLCIYPMLRRWSSAFVTSFYSRQSTRYNDTRNIAFGRTILQKGVQIAVIAPGADSPSFDRSTTSRQKLLAAKDDAIRRTQAVFTNLAPGAGSDPTI